MIKLLRKIHYGYVVFFLLFFFLLFWPLYYIGTRKPAFYLFLNRMRALHAFLSSVFTFTFFRFDFESALDRKQTYIFCANHSSNLDIAIFCLLAKGKFHFMGKQELTKNPVLGLFFRTIDIPVSRDSKISAFRAFKKAEENLDKGMSLIIFPEGKIGEEYPPVLHEFKNGPFKLAIEKNIPIVPVSIVNMWRLMWDDGAKYGTRPGIADIYVHSPINTENLASAAADVLKEEVFNKINSKLQQNEN